MSAANYAIKNGQAERMVQTFKNSMYRMRLELGDIDKKLANFRLSYCNTVHSTTGEMPAKVFLGRMLGLRPLCSANMLIKLVTAR